MLAVFGLLILLIATPGVLLAVWLLNVRARRTAGQRLAALGRAKSLGQPLSCDIGAYLCAPWHGSIWLGKCTYGVLRVRPALLTWEARFRRRRHTRDLTDASLVGERAFQGWASQDYIANYALIVRSGSETIKIMVRPLLAPLVRAGLDQVADGRHAAQDEGMR